jgi:glutaredoxin 2
MIKITKEKDKYLIEYIDHLNHLDYLENEDWNSKEARDKMIKERIRKVKRELQKLIDDSKVSSGSKE